MTNDRLGWDLRSAWGRRSLQATTSEVYGDPTAHPQTEEYWGNVNPIGIRACYDEGKRCAETPFHCRLTTLSNATQTSPRLALCSDGSRRLR